MLGLKFTYTIFKYNKSIYINLVNKCRLYKLRDLNLITRYTFDFGKKQLPENINNMRGYNLLKNYSFYPIILGQNKNKMLIAYINEGDFHYAIYNKKYNETYNYYNIYNDINKLPLKRTRIKHSTNPNKKSIKINKPIIKQHRKGYMFGYLYPHELNDSILTELNLNKSDNPIVLSFKLKQEW